MRNIKKLIINILLTLVALGLLAAAVFTALASHVVLSTQERIISARQADLLGTDCILVLGAGVNDGEPSYMLADRLDMAIELYENGASEKLLMSGDHGREEYDEVNVMKDYAVSAGVPSSDVFMDHAGFSTYDSIYRAKEVFQAQRVIIVTQPYHLYRALYIAESLGLEAWGVGAEGEDYAGQGLRDFREQLARVKDYFQCIFKPESRYVGQAIPVSGDGDITNDKPVLG